MARKTLLLCFIHGFRGDNLTFGKDYCFTEHLRDLVARELPRVDVRVLVYPKYETRGDLGECVMRFRAWLEEKVIDLEVAAGTSSPTIDPSVRTVLVGHSMGGIMAAESVLGIDSDRRRDPRQPQPAASPPSDAKNKPPPVAPLFPFVQGILALDTPFLGIAPGVVAHGAEGHYRAAATAVAHLGGLGALWGGSSNNSDNAANASAASAPPDKRLRDKDKDATAAAAWPTWGRAAALAGGAAAWAAVAAAGGAAAWLGRERIGSGLSWVSSHLEFVGCLARAAELRARLDRIVRLGNGGDGDDDDKEMAGFGFANLYTRLGRAATGGGGVVAGAVLGRDRTFCNLPAAKSAQAGTWKAAVNDKATDEVTAHTAMFDEKENPGYDALSIDAAAYIARWAHNDWYESSDAEEIPKAKEATPAQ